MPLAKRCSVIGTAGGLLLLGAPAAAAQPTTRIVGGQPADIATMPYDVFAKLVKHPLTDLGLERFTKDWEALQKGLGSGTKGAPA